MSLDPLLLVLVAATFVVAGLVKGVIGMGMPTVSLALLAATVGLPSAMALLLVPTIVTNVWQALVGGYLRQILRLLWPFLLASVVTVWLGVGILARVDVRWLSGLLGVLLAFYALAGLFNLGLAALVSRGRYAAPVNGALTGMLTGMTGSSVFPGVAYLQSLGLPRDMLIQAMGVLFVATTTALGFSMGEQRLLSVELGVLSLGAVVPAIVGMQLGQRLRQRLSESTFRRVFLSGLLAMGAYLLVRSLAG
ncbi:sulfite exporter TauE/SafE family protein [Halomonas sp. MCCC 1A17488]|uniref:Probable membrane transporter protein n=1 Tax=Billgrantia sulfidoxydans TaxID=2733484 RepID=A0ABX7WAA1_9GAMM|nr:MULTISPECIES: sulfite exporter TauE/SafE family protein [Halomonas]MCE8018468.1 sulfite exporter TauE/SafE family protein [Halomonas sp. MCCC 1A17488]MCG3241801.1 sulfite exporter TauE/SafE family protein [Halomonas sp. MCCC 1A17488]QPP49168.1 sulfite exporter TauE/SafE family protein [Halomonas sp. SS10-MC5]QTP56502.1 sulfite exporter TauE/SafE family protein [Halomonas sulfidoxydans]